MIEVISTFAQQHPALFLMLTCLVSAFVFAGVDHLRHGRHHGRRTIAPFAKRMLGEGTEKAE